MTTRTRPSGLCVVRCDRCGTETDPQPTPAKAVAAMPKLGWIRRRPGLEDFCSSCQE